MSGQTRSCLDRYSASRSGLTLPRKQTRSKRTPQILRSWIFMSLMREIKIHDHLGVGQKLNWLMLAEVKTNGGPSRTVLSAPTVNEPSLPAVNVWPWLPLSLPDAASTAAYPAR
jgi:hypothetical protein